MRPVVLAILTLVLSAIPAAQGNSDQLITWVTIKATPTATGFQSSAAIGATHLAAYSGGPFADVPARPIKQDTPVTVSDFRIRAWKAPESPAASVALYAVSRDASDRAIETLMATFTLKAGESVEVTDTEKYGAAHVTLSAALGPRKS
jgi:hypothetical protein